MSENTQARTKTTGSVPAQLLERVRRLSRVTKILLATGIAAAIAIAIVVGVQLTTEPYGPLYTQLADEDAASVVAKLKELKVPHKVTDGGRIEVPLARVHELRLEMAGAGLPKSGGVGFESFDKMKLGATEFEQKVMFRRALEGELTRTISSVVSVDSARVHLVLPERSVFATRRDPGSASVIVKLRPGMSLGPKEVGAVVHLVASAVPGLSADQVTLATTEGVLLHKPKPTGDDAAGAASAMDGEQTAEVRALESTLEERARAMVERVVGPGHVDVKVTADMDFSRIERTEDRFKPQKPILRSEELMVERTGGATKDTVAGVPGAESNLPNGSAPAEDEEQDFEDEEAKIAAGNDAKNAPGLVRHQHTRNFEVDRVTEKRISRAGELRRLTVAVVVDGVPDVDDEGEPTVRPRDQAEIDQLTALVRGAVGANEARNDVVTVASMAFIDNNLGTAANENEELAVVEEVAPPPTKMDKLKRYTPYAALGVLALALLITIAIVRRRHRRRRELVAAELLPAALPGAATVAALPESEEAAVLLNPREEALRRAADDPASAALVLRAWLGTEAVEEELAA